MANKEDIVQKILDNPQEIRKSTIDKDVYLYYGQKDRFYCVVAKHLTDRQGFLITAYPVDKIKEGEVIWTK